CNRPDAPVIGKAQAAGVNVVVFDKKEFQTEAFIETLKERGTGWIILAGFLWLIPRLMVAAWRGRIINIHPALLPDFGGRGMFGHHVHDAVIASGRSQTGITIHLVDDRYDHGETLFQATCPVMSDDTPDLLASRIHLLEHRWFPPVVERYIESGEVDFKQTDGNASL
ncbi:MAG: phosphoribosylglycinamide formyltransferase, partial [Bacteroidetes bacterium HGW-Bacteroidetes-22]